MQQIAQLIFRFFLGQGAVQAVGILTSFYLLRALNIDAYAQFSFAMSFQALAGLLVDLGFSGTIVPLVGSRRNDRAVVGRYVRSARHLRDRLFLSLSPVAFVLFLLIMRRHHWDWKAQMALSVSVFISIYFTGKAGYFAIPMVLHGSMGELYLPQIKIGLLRLVSLLAFHFAGILNSATAALSGTAGLIVSAGLLETKARRYLDWPAKPDAGTNAEVLRYILPAMPAMVFAAFQAQSSVFLISILGQTANIAQVSALGRLNQVFAMLTVFNVVIVEPFMARQQSARVLSRYLQLAALAAAACVPIVFFAFGAPDATLWLLGSKYQGLEAVVGWAVLGGALNYLQVLLWIMNRSRKWIYWRGTFLEIALTLLVEAAYLIFHGMRSTADAVYFSIVCTAGPLATHAYIAGYGLIREKRASTHELAASA